MENLAVIYKGDTGTEKNANFKVEEVKGEMKTIIYWMSTMGQQLSYDILIYFTFFNSHVYETNITPILQEQFEAYQS